MTSEEIPPPAAEADGEPNPSPGEETGDPQRRRWKRVLGAAALVIFTAVVGQAVLLLRDQLERPELEIVDVSVEGEPFPEVDLKIVNRGQRAAFATRVEVLVLEGQPRHLLRLRKWSVVPVSATYHVLLEPAQEPYRRELPVSHRVEPDGTERIRFSVGAKWRHYDAFVFRVVLRVFYDHDRWVETEPVELRIFAPDHVVPRRDFPGGYEEILSVLESGAEPMTRHSAVQALGERGSEFDERGREALIRALEDPVPEVSQEAAASLLRLGAFSELARGARHPTTSVRRAAVSALAESDAENFMELVTEALEDPDREVQRAGVMALKRWGARDPLRRCKESPDSVLRTLCQTAYQELELQRSP